MQLGEDGVLVRDQVDDAVREHDAEALVGERQLLDLALDELDIGRLQLGCSHACLRQHLRRHVDAGDVALLTDHLRGNERVGPRPAAEIEHALAACEPAERERIRNARERLDGVLRNVRELGRIVEILGPGATGRKDEVLVGLLRYGGVRLLDLALQQFDIELQIDRHRASSDLSS